MEIFKVGDKVYCIISGWGVVNKVRFDGDYPIEVRFDEESICYTRNGCYLDTSKPTLSFTEYTLQGFTQERPITLPEVGELCLVRDRDYESWICRPFKEYKKGYDEPYFVYSGSSYKQLKRIKILD